MNGGIPDDGGSTAWYGHSRNALDKPQTMAEHVQGVTDYAGIAAPGWLKAEARLAGLLHDLGKYSPLFQDVLRNKASGMDHWSIGAWVALSQYRSVRIGLVVQGHHIGLQKGDSESLDGLNPKKLATNHPQGRKLTATDPAPLLERLRGDGFVLPEAQGELALTNSVGAMLDTRMLFSALTDGDFVDTERHMREGDTEYTPRPEGVTLRAAESLIKLEAELKRLNRDRRIPLKTRRLRKKLADACQSAAKKPHRLFTLTAPTGTGKTLGMLRFALTQALQEDLGIRRIIIVFSFR